MWKESIRGLGLTVDGGTSVHVFVTSHRPGVEVGLGPCIAQQAPAPEPCRMKRASSPRQASVLYCAFVVFPPFYHAGMYACGGSRSQQTAGSTVTSEVPIVRGTNPQLFKERSKDWSSDHRNEGLSRGIGRYPQGNFPRGKLKRPRGK